MFDPNVVYKVESFRTHYQDGYIVIEYYVLVPDCTISGDFRREIVTVRLNAVQEQD